jgi:hypothetical protein
MTPFPIRSNPTAKIVCGVRSPYLIGIKRDKFEKQQLGGCQEWEGIGGNLLLGGREREREKEGREFLEEVLKLSEELKKEDDGYGRVT